ncbi:MAG: hypothetical protein LAO55_23265 [Acidobacteriia bacterium]|nr:hypothetical protein [Terriglobia bacterium]
MRALWGDNGFRKYEANRKWLRNFSRRELLSNMNSLLLTALLDKQPSSGGDREAYQFGQLDQIRESLIAGDLNGARIKTASSLALAKLTPPRDAARFRLLCDELLRDAGEPIEDMTRSSLDSAFQRLQQRTHSLIQSWLDFGDFDRATAAMIMRGNIEVETNPSGRSDYKRAVGYLEAAYRILDTQRAQTSRIKKLKHQALSRKISFISASGEPKAVKRRELADMQALADEINTPRTLQETHKVLAAYETSWGDPRRANEALGHLNQVKAIGNLTLITSFSIIRSEIDARLVRNGAEDRGVVRDLVEQWGSSIATYAGEGQTRVIRSLDVPTRTPILRSGLAVVEGYIPYMYDEPELLKSD